MSGNQNNKQKDLTYLQKFRHMIYRDDVTEIDRVAGMFARGFFSVVASEAGVGKTWLMQYTACQLSTGGTILNGMINGVQPSKVLIMSGETGAELMNMRLGRTNWGYNPENLIVYSSLDMGIAGQDYLLNTAEGKNTFLDIVRFEKPDIIYFDTLISFHTADESRQADMVPIYLFLARVARAFNCAIVLNHHTRKKPAQHAAKNYTQDDVIGSSAGVRMAHDVYLITREKKENDSVVIVKHVKSWDKKINPFSYTFTTDDSGFLDIDINLHIQEGYNFSAEFESFIAGFQEGAFFTVKDVADALRVSYHKARYKLEKYAENGQIAKITFNGDTAYKITGGGD